MPSTTMPLVDRIFVLGKGVCASLPYLDLPVSFGILALERGDAVVQ